MRNNAKGRRVGKVAMIFVGFRVLHQLIKICECCTAKILYRSSLSEIQNMGQALCAESMATMMVEWVRYTVLGQKSRFQARFRAKPVLFALVLNPIFDQNISRKFSQA